MRERKIIKIVVVFLLVILLGMTVKIIKDKMDNRRYVSNQRIGQTIVTPRTTGNDEESVKINTENNVKIESNLNSGKNSDANTLKGEKISKVERSHILQDASKENKVKWTLRGNSLVDSKGILKLTFPAGYFDKVGVINYSKGNDDLYWFYNKRAYNSQSNSGYYESGFPQSLAGYVGTFGIIHFSKFEAGDHKDFINYRYLLGTVEYKKERYAVFYIFPHECYADSTNSGEYEECLQSSKILEDAVLNIETLNGARWYPINNIRGLLKPTY